MKEKLEIETPQAKAIEVLRFKLMKTEQTCLFVPVALPKMTNTNVSDVTFSKSEDSQSSFITHSNFSTSAEI